jgi:hypothetical protein
MRVDILLKGVHMPNATSWRTTVSSIVSTAGSIGVSFVLFAMVAFPQIHFPLWILAISAFANAGGLLSLGINAKDKMITGGTIPQASSLTAIQYKSYEHDEAQQVLAGVQPVPVVVKPAVDMNAPLPPPTTHA